MVVERRVFSRLPLYLQTDQNNRDMYISDDVMFEPEQAAFVNGYIGDTSILTEDDLARLPPVFENSAERQKYQLSLGAVYTEPTTEERSGGAFYPDLIGQIGANGGLTNDPNRLFETPFYAWAPPFDYDKHTNYTRYYWTGAGSADVNGEYITKEPQGSKTGIFIATSTGWEAHAVTIGNTAPVAPAVGDFWEDSSTNNRIIFRWTGSTWLGVPFTVAESLPSTAGYAVGDYLYVTRTGPEFNRPLMWKYSVAAGRWIAQPVVVGPTPDVPVEGMIWEDTSLVPNRILKVYRNGLFVNLTWTGGVPSGTPTSTTYVYDTRNLSDITDGWSANNWWRHFEDLSPADRESLLPGDQAIRPIIEFWGGIEAAPGDTRSSRHDLPRFATYRYDLTADGIIPASTPTTIFQYQVGTGRDDFVLGFPVKFNSTGEFQFELTLETTPISDAVGYRFFKDTFTGLVHSIWAKSLVTTRQEIDVDGLAEVPANIASNPDHQVLTVGSRSLMLRHMAGNIQAQAGLVGNRFGLNSFRWTDKDPTVGTTIIDCENTLLRTMATLQLPQLSIPDVIRKVSRDYNRVLGKFINRMNQFWDRMDISNPDDTLSVTAAQAVDVILTELFIGRNEDFAYYNSDMGQYVETQVSGGIISVIGVAPRPIFVPPSPSRAGAAPTYKPGSFVDVDGVTRLRGHDGSLIPSFGDERDLIWLELHNRFFQAVPQYYRDETSTFSARYTGSNFYLANYYGNSIPNTTSREVVGVVPDATAVASPQAGQVYFDIGRGSLAYYDGAKFLFAAVQVDDIFRNTTTGEYYIYNGFGAFLIERFNNGFDFEYSTEEYRQILRREFERWASFQQIDFITNSDYDETDPFTWNYRSAGVEGNYMAIYQRLYHTIRPHSQPWEIAGYYAEPTWWRTEYVPTSVASDGTPRYANTHPMWADLQAGVYNPITNLQSDRFAFTAPIPVDAQGNLLDPIAAGVVDEDSLVPERRDDAWVYGDGGPAEQEFLNSTGFSFAVALLGYLMKPGRFVDTTWSELYIDIGVNGPNQLWRGPHVIHRDTGTRPSVADLPVHLEKVNNVVGSRLGTNAWISEYVRALGNDVTSGFGDVIRNTMISPGWRVAGFINPDRTVVQTLSGIKIPFEDVHTILHRSPPTRESFGSGVLVTREGTGYRVYGFDLFNPYFEIDIPVAPIAGGQAELREDFIATAGQHTFTTSFPLPRNVQDNDTAKVGILVNGLRLKPQHITVTGSNSFEIESIVTINMGDVVTATAMTTQSNPSTRVKQFLIEGVAFPYIDAGQDMTERVEYGRYFDTSPDVINFMLGYGRQLAKNGWIFDETYDDGRQIRDWLTGAKLFAAWVLAVESPWQNGGPQELGDFYYTPFGSSAKYQSQFGQVLNVEALQNGAYGIIDKDANPIDPELVFTSRIGNQITISPAEGSPEIYGVRILVAEDQHVVFFSNITKFNDLIYDPVIALYQSTLRITAYRTTGWVGRLDANGFVINRGDLLPNFEKQAKDIIRFYDRIDTLDDPVRRDQARELYGWYPNDSYTYPDGRKIAVMDAIGAEERSRFDYHRGMVHTKGTIRPLIAFSRGTSMGRDNVIVYEDWAWRWSEFGDTRYERVQFRVNKDDFRDQLQLIEFNVDDNPFDSMIQVPTFNRLTPDVGRWIMPPASGDNNLAPLRLPEQPDAAPTSRLNGTRLKVNLFDTATNITALRLFNYNPAQGYFDPEVMRQIEYVSSYDPARYTDGTGSEYSDGLQWGPDQVGFYWWDQTRLEYMDYLSLAPDYKAVARDWGRTKYYRATIIPDAQIGRVETIDPYQDVVVPHGLTSGSQIEVIGAFPVEYNGFYTVTVTSPTQFEIVINDALDVPASGDVRITTSFYDIYEWVESTVKPSGWIKQLRTTYNLAGSRTGLPINGDQTSYVSRVFVDSNGKPREYYYFWIISNTGDNPKKDLRADQVVSRLRSPTQNNIAWFGVIDENHMITFVNGERVHDGYAIELVRDDTLLDTHTEWLLISENDQFNNVPAIIKNKLLDCLAGVDLFGSVVPSPLLAETERYGSNEFPPQSVFQDRAQALSVFVTAANTTLSRLNLQSVEGITALFPLSAEGTFWSRAEYRDQAYEGKTVFDVVGTETIRNNRLAQKRYYDGDVVKVLTSPARDIWTGAVTDTTYVLDDGLFLEIGINNATLRIILDEATDPAVIRSTFDKVYSLFTKEQQNKLIFSILYEMMRQTGDADWFMKTSYVTTQIFDKVSQSPFVRPNEVEAIIANLIELKPYRTKLRASTFTYSIDNIEDVGVQINEFPDKKITLTFDRLNCMLEDEAGWDIFDWDTELYGWDKPLWDLADLGRAEYLSLGTITADPVRTVFTYPATYDPTLYGHIVVVTQGGNPIKLADLGVTATITTSHTTVTVTLSTPLNASYQIELRQSSGFYEGSEPTLGPLFENTLFQAVPSTYKHNVARLMGLGYQAPFPGMDECCFGSEPVVDPEEPEEPPSEGGEGEGGEGGEGEGGEEPPPEEGGEEEPPPACVKRNPQERISQDVEDSVMICVKNDWTPSYVGWDATPWDSTGWDQAPSNVGRRVFFVSAGKERVDGPGVVNFATSQNVLATDTRFVAAGHPYDIVRVDLNGVQVTEGLDFQFVEDAPWVVEFLTQPDISYTADGATTAFSFATAPYGVNEVFKNEVVQQLGIDYNISGTDVVFIQPAPVNLPITAYSRGRQSYASGFATNFATGVPNPSLNVANSFVFLDGVLQSIADVTTDLSGNVVFPAPVAFDTSVVLFTLGNDVGDGGAKLVEVNLTADGVQTSFVVGNNCNTDTGWVFVDGLYQVSGIDYTIPVYGTIQFTVAPANGAVVTARILPPANYLAYDQDHIVFLASGGATDNIPGLLDADPDRVVVFLGDQVQNGYSSLDTDYVFINGSPDQISWVVPPAPGTPVTVRVLRSITIDQTTVIGVNPIDEDVIRIVPNHPLDLGDQVTFYYNNFPVGPLGNFVATSVPTTYDVVKGKMLLTGPVLGGTITLTYTRSRYAANPTAILVRMANITDLAVADHLTFDPLLGFEDNRKVGLRILNTTNFRFYTWDGAGWIDMGITLVPTDQVLVLQQHQILEFDGAAFTVVFTTGGSFTTPPVLQYPAFGRGIISATYALGQVATASVDFPEAYQVMQFAGDS